MAALTYKHKYQHLEGKSTGTACPLAKEHQQFPTRAGGLPDHTPLTRFIVSDVNSCPGVNLKSVWDVTGYPVVALKKGNWETNVGYELLFYSFEFAIYVKIIIYF